MWINSAKEEWELYDFGVDPGELDDLTEKEPGVLERLVELGGFVRPSFYRVTVGTSIGKIGRAHV